MKDNLKGKVGTSVARNISKHEGWEKGSEGTRPEKSRTHGTTLVHEHSKQSNHEICGLTDFETRGGQKDIRVRKGSPVLGNKKSAR
jgi:hypothetical protein